MFSDPTALSTTRTASHVCRNWRNLTLDTPSLWEKLIDLNDITSRNYEWLTELLRRSGTASLWIRGDHIQIAQLNADPNMIPRQAFFDITHENWHRIEKLVVCPQADREFSPHSPQQWTALHLPAPELETFDVTFKWISYTHRPDVPITTIFAGHAPKLLHFILEIFTVDEHAPWLCQLRTMLFYQKYSLGHAFSVLTPMRKLQRLKLQLTHFYNADVDALPKIVPLPDLEYLAYDGRPTLGTALLDHIEIPINCSLYLPTTGILNGKEQEYLYVIDTYTRHARRFLQGNPPQVICIDLGTNPYISLKAGDAFPDKLPLNIIIPLHNVDAFTVVLDVLELQELSSVVELRISTAVSLDLRETAFFNCLTSIETIYANVNSLIHLGSLQNAAYIEKKHTLFPFLKVVNLGEDQHGNHSFGSYPVDLVPAIAPFFLKRVRDGHPITTLRLLEGFRGAVPNFEELEDAQGLKVLYTRFGVAGDLVHICGGDSIN